MPQYSYECPDGHEYTEVLPVVDYQKQTLCGECKKPGKKVIQFRQTEPTFSEKIFPYHDENLGRVVNSAQDRQRIMKEMGVVSFEGRRSTTAKQEKFLYNRRLHLRPPT